MLNKLFLLFLLSISIDIFSQDPEVVNYTIDDGLPSNEVYHVMQDSKGYLWISTDKGVSKYDGYSFENFSTDDGLKDNTVFFTHEDDSGRVWFLSYSPLLSYYNGNEIVEFEFNDSIMGELEGLSPKISFSVANNSLFIGTNTQGGYIINNDGRFSHIDSDIGINAIVSDSLNLFFRTASMKLTGSGRNKLTVNEQKFVYKRNDHIIPRMIQDGNIVYLSEGTNIFKYQDGRLKHLLKSENNVSSLYLSKEKILYVSTLKNGVELYEVKNDSIFFQTSYFNDKAISWVTEDFEGGMWISTLHEGILYHPQNSGIIRPFYKELPNLEVLDIKSGEFDEVFVSYANGSIWKITNESALNIENVSDQNKKVSYNPLAWNQIKHTLISTKVIHTWFEKSNERIVKYYEETRKTTYTNKKIRPLIKCIEVDSTGLVWIGSNEGLFVFEEGNFKYVINSNVAYMKKDEGNKIVYKVDALKICGQNIYVSALDGLNEMIDNKFNSLTNRHHLFSNRIEEISCFGRSTLFLGSRGNGLIIATPDSIYNINMKRGLASNLVSSITSEDGEIVWVGTNKGLNKLMKNGKEYKVFEVANNTSLPSKVVTKLMLIDDRLWVGTLKGLRVFELNQLVVDSIIPKLHINEVIVDGRVLDKDDKHILNFNQNTIDFHFTGITLSKSGEVNYEYKLLGAEKNWQSTSSREVRYNNLPFGTYTFAVRASVVDGIWSEEEQFNFEISPPFYLTWYFIAFSGLVVLTVILLVFFRREKRITEKAIFKQRTAQLELKALRSQMNPHFTFNTLSSIQQYILKNDSVKANDYLSQFATLIRKVLENSRHVKIPLNEEIDSLKSYLSLEQLRFPGKFEYSIEIEDGIHLDEIDIPPAILQPFVENSIIHGIAHKKRLGYLKLEINKTNDGIKCSITDNGVGRKKAAEINEKSKKGKRSLGIQITKDRLQLLKESSQSNFSFKTIDLFDENNMAIGTKVEVFISTKF